MKKQTTDPLNKKSKKGRRDVLSFAELAAFASSSIDKLEIEPIKTLEEPTIEKPSKTSAAIPVPNRFQAVFTQVELDRFEVFEEYLAKNKIYRLSRNAMLRTLLRLQNPSPEFLVVYQSVMDEDRRRVKGRDRVKPTC